MRHAQKKSPHTALSLKIKSIHARKALSFLLAYLLFLQSVCVPTPAAIGPVRNAAPSRPATTTKSAPASAKSEPVPVQQGQSQQVVSDDSWGIELKAVTTSFNNLSGVTHHQPSGKLLLAVNYPTGQPHNFELLEPDGTHLPFSNLAGFTNELRPTTVRDNVQASSTSAFRVGELLTGTGMAGVIARVSPDGSAVQNPWVVLPREAGQLNGGLYVDRTGVFGGDLIVATTVGNIWRVTSAGVLTLLANLSTPLAGVTTIPNDAAKYGPWAGRILVGAKSQGAVYAVDAQGHAQPYQLGMDPADIQLIPAHENFYGVDAEGQTLWGAPAASFSNIIGDVLVAQESPGTLSRIHWDGADFKISRIAQVTQWKQITFSTGGTPEIPAVAQAYDRIAVVRHAPVLNGGRVEGALWQLTGEAVTLAGSSVITSDLLLPGMPAVSLSGSPNYGGTLQGSGSSVPSGYAVTLSGNASLRHAITRTDPVQLSPIAAPPAPAGTRDVSLTQATESIGDFGTLRNLTLGGRAGVRAVPPGTYGSFNASSQTTLIFGVANSVQPSVYNLDSLTLSGGSELRVIGPVILNVRGDVTLTGSTIGAADVPSQLSLRVAQGEVQLVGGSVLYALVRATQSLIVIDGTSRLRGTVSCNRLNVSGVLQITENDLPPPPINRPPSVEAGQDQTITLPNNSVSLSGAVSDDGLPAGSTLTVNWTKSSGPGAVSFANPNSAVTTANFSQAGTYRLSLTASDSQLNNTDALTITVNPGNKAPVVSAGADQTITLPDSVNLLGTVTDDGLPAGVALSINWSKTGGPGDVSFGNQSAPATTASFSQPGAYMLTLSASDTEFTASSIVHVTVNAANQAPVVNAGPAQTITLPGAAQLNGTASDDGLPANSSLTTNWTRISGPGTVTFANASAPVTTASFSQPGTYVLRLTASDSVLNSYSEVQITVKPANQAPVVNAGADQTVTLPDSATLTGTATDDGLPEGSALSLHWETVSGPAPVSFGSAANAVTTVTFSAAGTYLFRLTATDSLLTSTDEVTVTVNRANEAPTVNAGADQTILLTQTANLNGTVSDDGLPAGSSVSASWSKVSGPGSVTFANPNVTVTGATFSEVGTYVLRLTATDGVLSSYDEVIVKVEKPNEAPSVNAGADRIITLPAEANLSGTVTDDGLPAGGALTSNWTKVSGPGDVMFGSQSMPVTTASFSQPGTYVLRLTASDSLLTGFDEVTVLVNPANQAPVVNAGAAQTVAVPKTEVLFYDDFENGPDKWATPSSMAITTSQSYAGTHSQTHTYAVQGNPASTSLFAVEAGKTYYLHVAYMTQGGGGYVGIGLFNAQKQGVYGEWLLGDGPYQSVSTWDYNEYDRNPAYLNKWKVYTQAYTIPPGISFIQINTEDNGLPSEPYTPHGVFFDNIEWSTNPVPTYKVGSGMTVNLAGTVTDDGLPAGGALMSNWTKVSGPGSVTFENASAPSTMATFGEVGTYVLRLTASDSVLTGTSDVTVTLAPAAEGNHPPTAYAGPDQALKLPGSVTLNGTVSDDGLPAGSSVSASWSKVSGPGNVTFANAGAAQTTAAFSEGGTYVLRLTASDSQFTESDDVTVRVNLARQPITVNAGPDQTITFPVPASLNATLSETPAGYSFQWVKVSGPGNVTFANASQLSTSATFSQPGSYVLRASAFSSQFSSYDLVTINVLPPPPNQAPTANAGPDQTIGLPGVVTLNGTVSDDGLPYGSTLTSSWTKVSGPGNVTFGNPAQTVTSATFSVGGTYVLQLTVTDSELTASDTVTINFTDPRQPPTADFIIPGVNGTASATVVSSSSVFSNTYSPSNLLDGQSATYWWAASGQVTNQFVKFRLTDGPLLIDRVRLQPMNSAATPKDFEVLVSDNTEADSDFKSVLAATLQNGSNLQEFVFPGGAARARFVKLVVKNNYGDATNLTLATFHMLTIGNGDAIISLAGDTNAARPGSPSLSINGAEIVDYSFPASYYPEDMLDYKYGGWATTSLTNQFAIIKLAGGKEYTLDGVKLATWYDYGYGYASAVKDFEVWVSNTTTDASAFTKVLSATAQFNDELQKFYFPGGPVQAKYVKYVPLTNYGGSQTSLNTNIFDVMAHDAPGVVDSTGSQTAHLSPDAALDGDTFTSWVCKQDQLTNQWVKLRLEGGTRKISGVRIMADNGPVAIYGPKDFEIRVSTTTADDAAFTTVYTGTLSTASGYQEAVFSNPVDAKYVQFFWKNGYGQYYIIVKELSAIATMPLDGSTLVSYSSQAADYQGAVNALDIDPTNWPWITPNGENANQYLKIMLPQGDLWTIDHVALFPGGGNTFDRRSSPKDFDVLVSTTDAQDSSFTTVFSGTLENADRSQDFTFQPVQARYVKLLLKTNYGATMMALHSFHVFSAQSGSTNARFIDRSTDPDGRIVSWAWDFGDGSLSAQQDPSHTYAQPGAYNVTLTVTDNNGLTSSRQMVYRALAPLYADFAASPLITHENGEPVFIRDMSPYKMGLNARRRWDFGDGFVYDYYAAATNYSYRDSGTYHVTMTLGNDNGVKYSFTKDVVVLNLPPTVDIDAGKTLVWGQSFTSVPRISDPSSIDMQSLHAVWNFGDGKSFDCINCTNAKGTVTHAYDRPGTYNAVITVMDKDGGSASKSATYTINKRPTSVTFLATQSDGPSSYLLRAKLTDTYANQPLSGKSIAFNLNGATATATTDQSGVAEVHIPMLAGTPVNLGTAYFNEDDLYLEAGTAFTNNPGADTPRGTQQSSLGTDFWLTFPGNFNFNCPYGCFAVNPDLNLYIAAEQSTTGTVTAPGIGFSKTFSVQAGQVTNVKVPYNASLDTSSQILSNGVHVTSQSPVAVYGLNNIAYSNDAYLGLPTSALGTEYIVLGYKNGSNVQGTEFGIVASENGTTVTITPSLTTDGHAAGVPYNITLNQGQTYQLRNETAGAANDLSGSVITSDKRIAVFGGHKAASIPDGFYYANHLVEQLPPVNTWGSHFVTMPLATRLNGDTFRFVASASNTHVYVNGARVATLNRGQVQEQIINGPAFIISDQPILLAQYANSTGYDGINADPSMILVPSYEQFTTRYTVTTPALSFPANYINVVASSGDVGSVLLDGTAISAASFTSIGSTGFSGAQVSVAAGTHNLSGPHAFGVSVYGFANTDAYGYPGGMNITPIVRTTKLSLTPQAATNFIGAQDCVTATVTDQNDNPRGGVSISFNVTGVNPGNGSGVSDASGRAQFCYTGTNGGDDLITASAGPTVNATATKTWQSNETRDHKGKDFWLNFAENGGSSQALYLYITAENSTTGTVTIPGLGFTSSFSVAGNSSTIVTIPNTAMPFNSDKVESKGIHVVSAGEVSVYGFNRQLYASDSFTALPTDVLGTEYIVLGYKNIDPNLHASLFALTATEDGTTVTITPPIDTPQYNSSVEGGYTYVRRANVPYNVTLNQGQTYQIKHFGDDPADLSGTILSSNKPVAVFGGHRCVYIPGNQAACNHVIEELTPTETWGKSFVTMPFAGRKGDVFRFMAGTNNTHVSVNGAQVATLNRGQLFQQLYSVPLTITADQPIMVAQYATGNWYDNTTGDPTMLLVVPPEQFARSYVLATPTIDFPDKNFVNLIVPTESAGSILFDGSAIPAASFTSIGSTGFSGAQVPVTVGTHTFKSDVAFGASAYGFATFDAYSYPGGMLLSQLNLAGRVTITPKTGTSLTGTQYCVNATVRDASNRPVVGSSVAFNVSGANQSSGSAQTDSAGRAQFCYTGANLGTDNITATAGATSDSATKSWTRANQAPVVNAGPDTSGRVGRYVQLSGSVTDDGLPLEFPVTYQWSRVSGPGACYFTGQTSIAPSVYCDAPGTFVLRLTASDSLLTASDDLIFTSTPPPPNNPPTSNAGPDQTITESPNLLLNPSNEKALVGGSIPDWLNVYFDSWRQAPAGQNGFPESIGGSTYFYAGNNSATAELRQDVDVSMLPSKFGATTQRFEFKGYVRTGAGVPSDTAQIVLEFMDQNKERQLGKLTFDPISNSGAWQLVQANELIPANTYWIRVRLISVNNSGSTSDGYFDALSLRPVQTGITQLTGTATDDGEPAGSLSTTWSAVSGPGTVTFALPNVKTTMASFSAPGTYVLRFRANDTQYITDDTVSVTVNPAPTNQAPTVNAGADQSITLPTTSVSLSGTVTDDGLPEGLNLTQSWTKISGPGTVAFSKVGQASTTATFTQAGTYVLRLSASDAELSASDDVSITVQPEPVNQAPSVNAGQDQNITLPENSVTLAGTATDDGLPTGSTLTVNWTKVSGPGTVTFSSPAQATTGAQFSTTGTYVLRLTASDSVLSSGDDVTVIFNKQNEAPTANAGADQTISLSQTANLNGTVSDDGLPAGSSVSASWSKVSGPGSVTFANPNVTVTGATFSEVGTYVLRLTATDGALSATDDVTITVDPAVPAPTVEILSPADGPEMAEVTTPTDVIGSVSGGAWKLEYSLNTDDGASNQVWTTFAQGSTPVTSARLGTLDSTMMLNGVYTVRLSTLDTYGQLASAQTHVLVDKQLKVGNFTVTFTDLSVPVGGLPIEVTRTYDSRDKRQGDFGVGWTLGIKNLRLEKSGVIGLNWYETVENTVFKQYCLVPSKPHVITITAPDNKVYKFQATTAHTCQQFTPITSTNMLFTPMPGTHGSLVSEGPIEVAVAGSVPGPVDLISYSGADIFNASTFHFTAEDGTVYVIDQKGGARKVTDTSGNSLTIDSSGIIHSSGKSVTFTRDAQGRITQVTDPSGNSLTYTYDARGDLVSFKDRENNVTGYGYNSTHGLLTITDPRGLQPIRNEYDDSGRLLSHTDGFGKTISYNHDIVNRIETMTDRLGRETRYEYDANGNVLRKVDARGGATSFTYDAEDNVLTETNQLGKTTVYTYDSDGNRTSVTDPTGKTTAYTYGPLHAVLTETDPLGHVTANTYNTAGKLLTMKDAAGNTTTYSYSVFDGQRTSMKDAAGNTTSYEYFGSYLTKETDASGNVTNYTYDANGNRATRTVRRTNASGTVETLTTTFQYDHENRLIKTILPDGSTTQVEYNSIGQQSATIDQLGHRTTYEYDEMGRPIKTTYADGTKEESAYDAEGRRTKSIDRAGRATTYAYDELGRLTKTTYPDGSFTSTTYDAAGQALTTMDALGHVMRYEYDAVGRRTKMIDALDKVTTFTYDAAGNQLSMKDALNNVTAYEYDNNNRRTKVIYPDGTTSLTGYNALGQVTSKTDQGGKTTAFEYDKLGRLSKVTDALSQVTEYGYNELGQQISQTDANNHTTRYEYDKMGRRVKRVLPLGMAELYTYDAGGNLQSRTDFNGKTTAYAYDAMNRLLSKTPDASLNQPGVSYTYIQTGRRATMTDATGTTTYTYDNRDRLTSKARPEGTLGYSYDAAGNLLTTRSSNQDGASVDYSYDELNRLKTVKDNRLPASANTTTYSYDSLGNLEAYAYPNGVRTSFTYNSLNRLTNLSIAGGGGTQLAGYAYTLGAAGNRLGVTEAGGRTVQYTYDDLYRLTGETIAGDAQAANNGSINYTYDAVGNRLTRNSALVALPSQTSEYDANDRLKSDSYDANGNTLASQGNTYSFDWENHLSSMNQGAATYLYDGDGNRVGKSAGGIQTRYLVDTNNPTGYAQVLDEMVGGTVIRSYTYGHSLISQRQLLTGNWTTSFYGYDGHGSTRLLTDAAGAVTDTYTYDAFGNLLSQTGTTPNEHLYAGELLDANLGFYHLRARYLNPASGRFWTMDTFEGNKTLPLSLQKYLYVNANPVMLCDPSGLSPSPYTPDFGRAVEREIGEIYRRDHPNNPNVTFGSRAQEGFNQLLKPDILNYDLKTYLEIKPLSISGVSKGKIQMAIYGASLGWFDYQPETWWVPSEHFIYPEGHVSVFFNADGILFYTDEQKLFSEAVAVTSIVAAANLLRLISGSLSQISELSRIGQLVTQAVRASQYNLQSQVALSEATGGRY